MCVSWEEVHIYFTVTHIRRYIVDTTKGERSKFVNSMQDISVVYIHGDGACITRILKGRIHGELKLARAKQMGTTV